MVQHSATCVPFVHIVVSQGFLLMDQNTMLVTWTATCLQLNIYTEPRLGQRFQKLIHPHLVTDFMSLLRPGVIKQHKPNQTFHEEQIHLTIFNHPHTLFAVIVGGGGGHFVAWM